MEDEAAVDSKLTEIFKSVFEQDDLILAREMTTDDIEQWDSLSHLSLIVAIEQEFSIKFTLGELQSMKNVVT